MERQIIGDPVKLLDGRNLLHAVGREDLGVGNERIVSYNPHAERLALAADQPTDVAVGVDAERLALNLRPGAGRETVAGHENHHGDGQLGHGVGILPGSIHDDDTAGRCGGQIDIIVPGACANDDFEVGGGGDDLGRDLVAADNQGVGIGHGGQQRGPVGVLFEQGELVTRALDDFTDTLDGLFGEGLFGGDQYFHRVYQCSGFLQFGLFPRSHLAREGAVGRGNLELVSHRPTSDGASRTPACSRPTPARSRWARRCNTKRGNRRRAGGP